MFKKIIMTAGIFFIASVSFATSFKQLSPDAVVFKAGPTEPQEELSIPWVEVILYPKKVESGREFFVEVGLASKAQKISARLDQDEAFSLASEDGLNWNVVVNPKNRLKEGFHFIQVKIEGRGGKTINRTLAFKVLGGVLGESEGYSYPVAVKVNHKLSGGKEIKAGEKVEALFKQTYYWVKTGDGKEGWVEAGIVEEPKKEIYVNAYQSYLNQEFDRAIYYYEKVVSLDPKDADAAYWLAKTYDKIGEEEKAARALASAISADSEHKGANLLAGKLASKYFKQGITLSQMGRNQESVDYFKQAVALRPASISYRKQLGAAYNRIGDSSSAQESWKQVLLIDPDNREVHALLRTDYSKFIEQEEASVSQSEQARISQADTDIKASNQYVKAVRESRTNKGTTIVSAIKAVLSMTRSLGTKVYEEGWKAKLTTGGFLISYDCKQERLGKIEPERFTFKVDLDSGRVEPHDKNARLLMNRW